MRWKVKQEYFCLLCTFCSIYVTLSSINDEVLTEKESSVKLHETVTLKCVLRKPQTVLQVTWQKISGKNNNVTNVATYSTRSGANVIGIYRDLLNITHLGLNETAITVWRTSIEDAGCYRCLFNVFPVGAINGETCLSISDEVLTENNKSLKLHETVTLKCVLRNPQNVRQVTWQKISGKNNNVTNVATYSTRSGANVIGIYQDLLNITHLGLNETAITVWRTSIEDAGCYRCLFNVFPVGAINGETCLSISDTGSSLQPIKLVLITAMILVMWHCQ